MNERRLFSPPSSLPASVGPAPILSPSPNPPEASPPGTRVKNLMISKVSAAPPFNTGVRVKRLSLFFLGGEKQGFDVARIPADE